MATVATECGEKLEKDSSSPELDEGEPPIKRRCGPGRPKGSKNRCISDSVTKDLPPRSCRRQSVPNEVIIPAPPARCLKFLSTDWTLTERQKLLSGLRIHNFNNIEELSKCVGTKSEEEVEWFIQNLKIRERLMSKEEELPGKNTAPIEHWLKTCEDIVRSETDHSLILGSVMAVAGELEPHHPPYDPKTQPDYTKIYDYLARLLHRGPAPELSPIDSAIVLDLLQNTVDLLRHTDIHREQEMLKKMYLHLNNKKNQRSAEQRSTLNMSAEPNSPDAGEEGQQVGTSRNNRGETSAGNNTDTPSTSREESPSSNAVVAGPCSSRDGSENRLDPLLANIDQSRRESRTSRPRKSTDASGGKPVSQESTMEPGSSTGSQLQGQGRDGSTGSQLQGQGRDGSTGSPLQGQGRDGSTGSQLQGEGRDGSTGSQLQGQGRDGSTGSQGQGQGRDGPKAGKLVSINPFSIQVKYLKLGNIQKEDPR
ncbi:uncharacterized protein LOC135502328 [Lineus longissimus]|uniref:uncharacterized protein LOC135502328 n=1 Tax=Lineus longissimus TaxID=88925 RepID=UPI002B4D7C00